MFLLDVAGCAAEKPKEAFEQVGTIIGGCEREGETEKREEGEPTHALLKLVVWPRGENGTVLGLGKGYKRHTPPFAKGSGE